MTRQEANKEILEILGRMAEMYPDLRFQQMLYISEVSNYGGEDKFYEESESTLDILKYALRYRPDLIGSEEK